MALLPEFSTELRTLKFELIGALPVPHGNVPIPDILEFKERRKTELADLHRCLDDAYLQAIQSPDPGLSGATAIADLKAAIEALDSVSLERWKRTRKFDFAAELNVDGGRLVQGAASGAAFDFFASPLTLPIGAVVGAVASVIKVSAKASASFEPAKAKTKLSYLSLARKEEIL